MICYFNENNLSENKARPCKFLDEGLNFERIQVLVLMMLVFENCCYVLGGEAGMKG